MSLIYRNKSIIHQYHAILTSLQGSCVPWNGVDLTAWGEEFRWIDGQGESEGEFEMIHETHGMMILTKILTIYIRSCDFHRESRSLASYMMHLRAWWVSKRPSWLRYWIACGRSPRDHFDALAWSQSNLPTQHEVRTTCSTSAQPSKRGRDSAKSLCFTMFHYVSMESFLDQKLDHRCHLVSFGVDRSLWRSWICWAPDVPPMWRPVPIEESRCGCFLERAGVLLFSLILNESYVYIVYILI